MLLVVVSSNSGVDSQGEVRIKTVENLSTTGIQAALGAEASVRHGPSAKQGSEGDT